MKRNVVGFVNFFYPYTNFIFDFKDGCIIETPPVEVFVNLLLYNKVRNSSIGNKYVHLNSLDTI